MKACIVAITTVSTKRDAEKIARALVEERAAACVQIVGPIHSTYRWKGRVESSKEWLCLIKATRSSFSRIRRVVKKMHPYELPELVALPIVEGSGEYLAWISGMA